MAKNIVSLLYNRQVCVYPRGSFACTFRPSQIQLGMRLGRKFDWVGGVFPDAGNLLPDYRYESNCTESTCSSCYRR